MDHDFRYIGCFVDPGELARKVEPLGKPRLSRVIAAPHVTFRYQPKTVDRSLFGQKVLVTVVGYGCDGENEGLKVQMRIDDPRLAELAEGVAVPHITLSVSRRGKPVNSSRLRFSPVTPFVIEGVFGGLDINDELRT